MEKIIFKKINTFQDYIEQDDDFAVAADSIIKEYYPHALPEKRLLIAGGERAKTKEVLFEILEYLNENNISRSGTLYIVGGGSISDVANFAASIYMRGIRTVIVPTTLLSIVDASIGGKTAINFFKTKNNIGSFHYADKVIIDKTFLHSLGNKEINDGLVEGLKLAALYDKDIFFELTNYIYRGEFQKAIALLVEYAPFKKREVVALDFEDRNQRTYLNVGHTVGHFLESKNNYKISHGEAVLKGLILEALLQYSVEDVFKEFVKLYQVLYGNLTFDIEDFNFSSDKKLMAKNSIRLPIIKNFGEREIVEVDKDWLEKVLKLKVQEFFQ